MKTSRFTLAECRRCGAWSLIGWAAGLSWRLDTVIVPPRHAAVLYRYRVPVLLVFEGHTGLYADLWDPWTHRIEPGRRRWLLVRHTCHAKEDRT